MLLYFRWQMCSHARVNCKIMCSRFYLGVGGEESANGKKRASNQLLGDLLNTC